MHRYIPVIAAHEGFTNIGEKIVHHQAENTELQIWIRSVY